MFKASPGLAFWKGEDEPQWGEMNSPETKRRPRSLPPTRSSSEEDPDHPVWIVQAPRGTIEQLKPYNATYDITGVDIYPISYPPGPACSKDANKEISMVGDYTRKMIEVVEDKKPVWLTLQIAWSGVSRPGQNTLRFPTFPEAALHDLRRHHQRRARPDLLRRKPGGRHERARQGAWDGTGRSGVVCFEPVIEEVGDKGPLANALVAAQLQASDQSEGRRD